MQAEPEPPGWQAQSRLQVPRQQPAAGEPDVTALVGVLRQGRLQDAESQARSLLGQYPDSGLLWKVLGVVLARQGREALPALRRAAGLLPADAEAHRNLAAVLKDLGQLPEALASLERSLEIEPRDSKVLVAAADCLCALGRPGEAVPLYERALERDPRLLEAHNNLGNALQELGECARAVDCYRQALALSPGDAQINANLGNALRQLGRLEEALASGQRAVALDPAMSLAHNNLGLVLAALGRRPEAAASFRHAVQLDPRFLLALHNLGNVLSDLGEHREALGAYARAVDLDPRRAESHCYVGGALYELRQVAEAIASFERALALEPSSARARLGLAAALRLQGRAAEAEAACREIVASDPNHAAALTLLGDLRADRGDFAQAQTLFERALALDRDSAALYCSIAAHRRMTDADDAWRQEVERLLTKPLRLEHEIGLRFALGKYHDDRGHYAQAFGEYHRANELSRRHGTGYDPAKLTRQVDAVIEEWDRAFLGQSHAGASDSELPVFVVGMPRSGTSLTEQILASHPQAYGAGELEFWEEAAACYARAGPHREARSGALAGIARDYLALLGHSAGGARRVIDKMPGNFLYAGLIHAVFPRVRIIHMQRHPLDTCASIYFQNFANLHPYASDFDSLAHYYGEYLRITRHWRAVLPAEALLEVPYEALVANQQHWTGRMLGFIGLPWDERCLDFHRTERVVITASRWQVRQKMNAASVGRWRNYEQQLAPLRPLLELAGEAGCAAPEGVS
ncbi:MAG: tetratricopeptide repeat protein [Steroidobacteraceae bacterium]